MATPIGTMERFAIAEDRTTVLAELIPGSDDYFFYHSLHYQNTAQLDRAEAILKDWIAAHKGAMTALMHAMMDRQRLLTYDQSPQQTVDYLVRRLGIQLHHSPPAKKGARRYQSELSKTLIDLDRLVKESLRDNVQLSPAGIQIAADWYLAADQTKTQISLHDFLKRVNGPYLLGLDRLVIKELQSRNPRDQRFGDLAAHQFLTLEELDLVGRAVPAVRDDSAFVNARLMMLRPSGEVDLSQQPELRRQYLAQVESYLRTLPQSYNSMKASATYRLLEANLAADVWDRELFMRYLQLPRQSPIVNPILVRSGIRANLNEDFTGVAFLPPIRNEQPLVETYLQHFLRDARETRAFERYLQPDFLRKVFARTKLMSGVANPQPFYDMLSAAERKQLRDKVQIQFAPQNRLRYSENQPTELLVDLKNVDKLIVRVYEMNSLAYYRSNSRQLDTDIDLDGLIATHEKTIQYTRPAIELHREKIAIPQASGRGVWIIDLVGKGLRARTLIRRGDLQTVRSSDAGGVRLTVLDENRKPVSAAKMLVGNQEFAADESGRIFLPMVSKATEGNAIVTDGKLAKRIKFRHLQESYSLSAGFYLDRTLLQTGSTAQVLIRPRLNLAGTVVDPALLKEVSVKVIATDLDGIQTSKQFSDLELNQDAELNLSFRVPSRVASIQFQLSGHVIGLSDRRKRELSTGHQIQMAGIRRTTQTVDAFLSRDGNDYVIETRGRTGEAVPGTTVRLSFKTVVGDVQPSQNLQSDDQGQVRLGPLDHVTQLEYGIAGGSQHRFDLQLDQQVWPSSIHISNGQPVRLPSIDGRKAESYRLLELREGKARNDLSSQLKLQNGFLSVQNLTGGDYKLVDRREGKETLITVVDGPIIDRVLVGKIRHRDQSIQSPISLRDVKRGSDGSLTISLSGQTEAARVHLVASRYFDQGSPLDELHLSLPALRGRQLSLSRCGYVSDLRLGDEYEYVLRRQYAKKYAGVMLPQPSVLLNPWETQSTSNQSQGVRTGDSIDPSSAPAAEQDSVQSARQRNRGQQKVIGSDYDFVRDSGLLVANMVPDADGTLTIPAETIKGLPIIQIIVADPATVLRRTVTSKLTETQTEDLRLAESLPTDQSLSFERAVSIVSQANPLDLESLGSAQVQVYGDVASLMGFYRNLIDDTRLDEFQILENWNALEDLQKRKAYSELASHELHLFLKMHDPEFFNAVIRPYLDNKKEKQFIDRWLLDHDLSEFTELWRYRQLSSAEQALLAIRVPSMRPHVQRDLSEAISLLKQDYDAIQFQVESALRSRRLNEKLSVIAGTEIEMELADEMRIDSFGFKSKSQQQGARGTVWAAPSAPRSGASGMAYSRALSAQSVQTFVKVREDSFGAISRPRWARDGQTVFPRIGLDQAMGGRPLGSGTRGWRYRAFRFDPGQRVLAGAFVR